MRNQKIGFVGGGNMACSLIGGLLSTNLDAQRLLVSEPESQQRNFVQTHFGVMAIDDNNAVVDTCDIVVFAIKPQVAKAAIEPLKAIFQNRKPLAVSIIAGVREPDIQHWLGGEVPIVRAMPNTPALVGSGAAGLYANAYVTDDQRDAAESLLRAVGVAVWIGDERLMDVVTALSGSGPAYFLLFMENLEQAAVEQGLDPDIAHLLTLETCLGAARLAMESSEGLAELRRRVTSPGGTTERALALMENEKLGDTLKHALAAATKRAEELAQLLGDV